MIQSHNCLSFHVNIQICFVLVNIEIITSEEESFESVSCSLPFSSSGKKKHPVNLLGCAVVACMFCVTKLICVAMQWSWCSHSLIGLSPINKIQKFGFNPAIGDLFMGIKSDEPFAILPEFTKKIFNVKHPSTTKSAGIAIVFQPRKEHGQHTIHLDMLEINVGSLESTELLVPAFDAHVSALLLTFPRCRMPLSSRRIWKNSKPLSVRSTS